MSALDSLLSDVNKYTGSDTAKDNMSNSAKSFFETPELPEENKIETPFTERKENEPPKKRGRGRPKGSLNKKTIAKMKENGTWKEPETQNAIPLATPSDLSSDQDLKAPVDLSIGGKSALTTVDLIISNAVSLGCKFVAKKRVSPKDIKLSRQEIAALTPLADKTIEMYIDKIGDNPAAWLGISMLAIYISKTTDALTD